jgi:capsular exopolysaccharide synthesis family protein
MAKVYEALRRAEEERRRRSAAVPPAVARVEWEPVSQTVAPPSKTSLLKRLFRRGGGRATSVAADELNKRRIALLQPDSYVAEQYRSLRGRLDALASQRPLKTLVVTSPLAGEGKTTAAINLGLVTALSLDRKVLLIDCDLRRPRVHRSLGLQPVAGLAEVLTGQATLDEAIMQVEGVKLDVLPVRSRPSNPSELLDSDSMTKMIEEVSRRYDRVILDTPAALGLPDAKAVCELCDGMVMVVRADKTSQQDVQTALELLDRRRVLGLILNGAPADRGRYGYTS